MSSNSKSTGKQSDYLILETEFNFRYRIVLSLINNKPIKITKIRNDLNEHLNPGIASYEIKFLRLIEKFTNGTFIEISHTGTQIVFKPGIIIGCKNLIFDTFIQSKDSTECKSIGYYVEPLLVLLPFTKLRENFITFKGITSKSDTAVNLNSTDESDFACDTLRFNYLPLMEKFGIMDISLTIFKRGSYPNGGGELQLHSKTPTAFTPNLQILDEIKFDKVMGIVYGNRISPSIIQRIDKELKRLLGSELKLPLDYQIMQDQWKGENSGKSPGYGVFLQITNSKQKQWSKFAITSEVTIDELNSKDQSFVIPEDLAKYATYKFLEEIDHAPIVNTSTLPFLISLLYFNKVGNLSRLLISKKQITPYFIKFLRDINLIFNNKILLKELSDFESTDDNDSNNKDNLLLVVKGSGVLNTNRKVT
ncbi:18S rRNA biogenesis protein [Hanseniaspora valbyensis NRRL Y-1626]|uniref:18S rRNA biogenesis protein n=1 Tax=Hanseniaspora valbyensis NRRL Y-1626 TaxID=766949 RepID=A0A1B7TC25_9ASCO|nr:18S rRNA biogenesis protein [Hanseniaspora valbyensis NRRL Y-1626]